MKAANNEEFKFEFVGMNMEYKLEELFDLQMGKTPSRNNPDYWDSNDHKWISIGDLSKCGKYISDTKEYLSDKAVADSGISQIPANTVIMSFKLSIGKTAITAEPMYSNEAIMSFRDLHKIDLLPDYIYYLLCSKNWDAGTNKAVMGKTLNKATLSQIKVKVHTYSEQKEIVQVLDKVNSIIESRKNELQSLDDLIKARFVEMFVDKGYPVLKWDNVFSTTTGKLDSNAMVEDGEYPFFTCAKEVLRIDKYAFDQEALLLAGNNAQGKYDVKYYKGKFNAYQRTYVLGLKDKWSYRMFQYQLEDKLQYLQQQSLGGLTKYLTLTILAKLEFIIPPKEEQDSFEQFVAQIDKSKVVVQKALDEAQVLFDSLMQKYFG